METYTILSVTTKLPFQICGISWHSCPNISIIVILIIIALLHTADVLNVLNVCQFNLIISFASTLRIHKSRKFLIKSRNVITSFVSRSWSRVQYTFPMVDSHHIAEFSRQLSKVSRNKDKGTHRRQSDDFMTYYGAFYYQNAQIKLYSAQVSLWIFSTIICVCMTDSL